MRVTQGGTAYFNLSKQSTDKTIGTRMSIAADTLQLTPKFGTAFIFDWQNPFVSLKSSPFSRKEITRNDDALEQFANYLIQNHERIEVVSWWRLSPHHGKQAEIAEFKLDNVKFTFLKRPDYEANSPFPCRYILTIHLDPERRLTCQYSHSREFNGLEIQILEPPYFSLAMPLYSTAEQQSTARMLIARRKKLEELAKRSTLTAEKLEQFFREILDPRLDTFNYADFTKLLEQ